MDEQTVGSAGSGVGNQFKRRGLIAGIAALGAGLLARLTDQKSVQAAHGPSDAVNALHTGPGNPNNIIPSETFFSRAAAPSAGYVLHIVDGSTTVGSGAFIAEQSGAGHGFVGSAKTGNAIIGSSISGFGTVCSSTNGVALLAQSGGSDGVQAVTNGGAVDPINTTTRFAAQFLGGQGVKVTGHLQVTGIKSAIVPHRDGLLRQVYCMESTEPFFEDFGEARLSNGGTTVTIDPDFGDIVVKRNYQVFLTPYGQCNPLYVAARNENSFEVRESHGGQSSVTFGYRLIALRADVQATRLAKVRDVKVDLHKVDEQLREVDRSIRSPR